MKRKRFNAKEKLSYFSLFYFRFFFFLLFKHRKIRILQEEKNSNSGREITAGHRTCPVKLASCPVNLMLKSYFVWTLSTHKHYPS